MQQEDITFVNIYTHEHRSTFIDKAIINQPKGINRQQYNNSRGIQHPTFNNALIVQTENLLYDKLPPNHRHSLCHSR